MTSGHPSPTQLLFFLSSIISLLLLPFVSPLKGECQTGDNFTKVLTEGKSLQKQMIKSMCYAVSAENLNKYFIGLENSEILGEGNFGVVYKYQNPKSEFFKAGAYQHDKVIAVKKTKEMDYEETFQELNSSLCLASFDEFWENETSNLVVIDYCFFDAAVKPRQYYFTLKYYPYTLVDFIDGTANVENYNYQMKLVMIVLGIQLEKMHQRNLLHRDIKPSNVVLDTKLMPHFIDFGTMSMFLDTASSFVGTATYMAPESTKGKVYGRRADLFSLGLLFNNLVNRDTSSHFQMLKNANAKAHFKAENFKNYNLNVNDLVWPDEYKFLAKLLKNSVHMDKILKGIIDQLEKMVMQEHVILQQKKNKKPQNMTKEEKIRTVRSMAWGSVKSHMSTHHAMGNISHRTYNNQIIV